MSDAMLPLLDLFTKLQRMRTYPLGVSDYLLALEALSAGVPITTREELIFLCQVLWAKSPKEQMEVAQELNALLPKKLTAIELEALAAQTRPSNAQLQPAPLPELPEPESQPVTAAPEKSQLLNPEQKRERNSTEADPQLQINLKPEAGNARPGLVETGEKNWEADPRFDYVGSLPITRRQMKRAWRYMRLIKRVGAPVELDVEATIAHTYRLGVFINTILMPRRTNLARLLILADEDGSMVPFRRVTRPLLESAQQSGLAEVAVFFFHDVIKDTVYRDASLTRPELLDRVLNSSRWTGILIISDGGAARGNHDEARITDIERFVNRLKRATPNVAWLNPTPRSRWQGTTAGELPGRCGISMFTLDRAGLDAAVDATRGRAR